jgi:hypothetical protein
MLDSIIICHKTGNNDDSFKFCLLSEFENTINLLGKKPLKLAQS